MQWEELITLSERTGAARKLLFQEEVQKAILSALSVNACFDSLVFQGGTALRLFHGNPRFSEDIDLVLVEGKKRLDLGPLTPPLERFVHDTFPFLGSVEVGVQKDSPDIQRLVLKTGSGVPEQRVRVHVELVPVPSYRNRPRILDFPPLLPAVRVEDVDEILADKVLALAFRPYLKGRDLWDVHFITEEKGAAVSWELVEMKARDYGHTPAELGVGLENASERILAEGMEAIRAELERFLPAPVLVQYRPHFEDILKKVGECISDRPGNRKR